MPILEKFVIHGGKPLHGKVRIGGAKNAAVLALTILGTSDEIYHQKLVEYKENMRKMVLANNE